MGIQGLLPFLSAASMPVNIAELTNCVAIVDVYCWLHKAAYGCSEELYEKIDTDVYVHYCVNRVRDLMKHNIKCILVFDGLNLPSKRVTEEARRRNREKTKERVQELLRQGNTVQASEMKKRCIDITPEMAKKLIVACRKNNIDYIVAPYEADAQIGYLMKQRMGDFVMTEDSDLILFECDYVLVKEKFGRGTLIRKSKVGDCLGPKAGNFSFEKFRRMCILSGCDYLPSLPGIGLQKAKKFFGVTMNENMRKALPKLPSYLNMKGLKVDQEYIDGFIRAENTFKYQLVFCPLQRKLTPFNPYAESVEAGELEYAGRLFDNELAFQWSLGNVDKKTMKVCDNYSPVSLGNNSIWSQNYKPRACNPLDLRFYSSGELPSTPLSQSFSQSFSQSPFSSQKRSSNEPSPTAKRMNIDKSILDCYRPATNSQETEPEDSVVKSRYFEGDEGEEDEEGVATKSLNELISERNKMRQRLSFLCTLEENYLREDNSDSKKAELKDGDEGKEEIESIDQQDSTPSSSQSSNCSGQSTLSTLSSLSSSQSSQSSTSANRITSKSTKLAEPITRITPPSEKMTEPKPCHPTAAYLLERFAFKKSKKS